MDRVTAQEVEKRVRRLQARSALAAATSVRDGLMKIIFDERDGRRIASAGMQDQAMG
jgi:hypothetical protein